MSAARQYDSKKAVKMSSEEKKKKKVARKLDLESSGAGCASPSYTQSAGCVSPHTCAFRPFPLLAQCLAGSAPLPKVNRLLRSSPRARCLHQFIRAFACGTKTARLLLLYQTERNYARSFCRPPSFFGLQT